MNTRTISSQTELVLELKQIKGVGPGKLRAMFSAGELFSGNSVEELLDNVGMHPTKDELIQAHETAQIQVELAKRHQTKIISALDVEYPELLKKSKFDPFLLYVKGKLSSTPDKSVAIIGTRVPTEHSKIIDERITTFFVERGWSIVSGLAFGCDCIAHQTAINLKGHTVAVLAHGLDTVAPPEHAKLAERIMETGGALISSYSFGTKPAPYLFADRDKLQAAMVKGVVMIASGIKGGSLIASRSVIQDNRWLAVPLPTKFDQQEDQRIEQLNRGKDKNTDKFDSKVRANLVLVYGSEEEKARLMGCEKKRELLERIIILKNKDDYANLLEKLESSV